MAKLAILSDIHANYEALKSVLTDVDAQGVDEIIVLGDVIGYGPQPQECCDLLRKRENMTVLQGNHEQGLINIHHLHGFNQPARDALRKTREWITEETYQWLVSRPKSHVVHGCRFVHGTPPHSVNDYLWKYEKDMGEVFRLYPEAVCFVGHTHDLMRFTYEGGHASDRLELHEGVVQLEPDMRHLLNVGAVGQPRDGDNSAKYALFDVEKRVVEIRYISYDIEKTVKLIWSNGLNRGFGNRLW